MSEPAFITRQQAAMRFGCYDAAAIQIWKRKGHPLPQGYRAAIRVNGIVIAARSDKTLHSQLITDLAPMGDTVEEGFTFDP